MLTLPGDPNDVIVSMNYYFDDDGQSFVDLFDNPVLGWVVDEADADSSHPVVTGTLPPPYPECPQWAHIHADSLYVPDMWRGTVLDFFTWLATAGGANRKLRGNFRHPSLQSAMNNWSQNYPDQFNDRAF
jgi:hypothetical protein